MSVLKIQNTAKQAGLIVVCVIVIIHVTLTLKSMSLTESLVEIAEKGFIVGAAFASLEAREWLVASDQNIVTKPITRFISSDLARYVFYGLACLGLHSMILEIVSS